MKKLFSAHVRTYAVAAGMTFALLQSLASVAAPRLTMDDGVVIPYDEAARMAEVLEKMLTRAPRFDAPQLGDPDFPVGFDSADADAVSRFLCIMQEQLDDIESTLDNCCSTIDDCCSTIDHIDDVVGDFGDSAIDFADCITESEIQDANATVISWLKTIMRDLRGLVQEGGCQSICDIMESNN